MSKKPYIYKGFEWLEIARKTDWNDPRHNPNDLSPYSEFQKPYLSEKGDNDYPSWEWSWPPFSWPPLDDITYPDPVENDCSVDEDCVWAGIMGRDDMQCDECSPYTVAFLWLGCGIAPGWAALGSWTLASETTGGGCHFLFENPTVIATVCCDSGAVGQFTVTYQGVLDCVGSKTVLVGCGECCEDMELTGADTVTSGESWVGTISTPCPSLTCSVVSNSGCTIGCLLNEAGSQVTVATDAGDCGSFTVTVSQDIGGDCPSVTSSKVVRLSEGNWNSCNTLTFGGTHVCYGNAWTGGMYRATVDCGTGGWGFINARDCDSNIIHQFTYEEDCCDGCGGCVALSHTRGYTSLIWSCSC